MDDFRIQSFIWCRSTIDLKKKNNFPTISIPANRKIMSTAFLVDNILNDKEDRCDSIESDTESDATSDLKDSCGSPGSGSGEISLPNHNHRYRFQYDIHHHHLHHRQQQSPSGLSVGGGNGGCDENTKKINRLSESIFRTYNTMMLRNDSVSDEHLDDSSSNFIEMCCSKCGHFQQLTKRNGGGGGGGDDGHTEIDIDFKCDKCECQEGVLTTTSPTTTTSIKDTATILKESAKPFLKFSVSAILGDRKECVKARTGKHKMGNGCVLEER